MKLESKDLEQIMKYKCPLILISRAANNTRTFELANPV